MRKRETGQRRRRDKEKERNKDKARGDIKRKIEKEKE